MPLTATRACSASSPAWPIHSYPVYIVVYSSSCCYEYGMPSTSPPPVWTHDVPSSPHNSATKLKARLSLPVLQLGVNLHPPPRLTLPHPPPHSASPPPHAPHPTSRRLTPPHPPQPPPHPPPHPATPHPIPTQETQHVILTLPTPPRMPMSQDTLPRPSSLQLRLGTFRSSMLSASSPESPDGLPELCECGQGWTRNVGGWDGATVRTASVLLGLRSHYATVVPALLYCRGSNTPEAQS